MADRITIRDVAERSGVSVAAASRALNGRPGVRPDVRQRVELIADALGYRPNRSAQNLAGGRASMVGLVVGCANIASDLYTARLVEVTAAAAEARGQALTLIVEPDDVGAAIRNLVSHRQIDGVLVSALANTTTFTSELLDTDFPAVLIAADEARPEAIVVDAENLESSAAMVGHLLDGGATRVATITGGLDRSDSRERLQGYRLAHEQRGLEVDDDLIVHSNFSSVLAYERADELLARRPDAVFCANDQSALGLYRRVRELGIPVPDGLSIAGFDGALRGEFSQPRLTSVVQPMREIVDLALEFLLEMVAGEPREPTHVSLTPELFFGDTTR